MSVRDLIDRSIALREEVDQLLHDEKPPRRDSQRRAWRTRGAWVPMMDITESEHGFHVSAELPGVAEEDVAIEISKNRLTISGVKGAGSRHGGETPFFRERSFGGFHRTILLPSEVDAAEVAVAFDRGVLTVTLRKALGVAASQEASASAP